MRARVQTSAQRLATARNGAQQRATALENQPLHRLYVRPVPYHHAATSRMLAKERKEPQYV